MKTTRLGNYQVPGDAALLRFLARIKGSLVPGFMVRFSALIKIFSYSEEHWEVVMMGVMGVSGAGAGWIGIESMVGPRPVLQGMKWLKTTGLLTILTSIYLTTGKV